MATLQLTRSLPLRPSVHLRHRRAGPSVLRLRCRVSDNGGDDESGGGREAPESLFMKELRRRGMTPASLLDAGEKAAEAEVEEDLEGSGGRRRVGAAAAAGFEKAVSNQRERSMALNSEGLEGLIPRAKLLLSLGGTFFLGFWPLMMVTITAFAVLYFLFGNSFVHDASKMSISSPPYIDPYALLEDERLSQVPPNVN